MNALAPIMDFQPAYGQLDQLERLFCDGYVKDIELIAEKTGKTLFEALRAPFPFELDNRSMGLLARPLVRAAIAERINDLSNQIDVSTYRTLKELTSIAYSNITNYVKIEQGGPLGDEVYFDMSKCTPEMMSAVKSFEIEEKPRGGQKIKFVLHDKMAALTLVARYQGLLADENPHWRQAQEARQPVKKTAVLPANADDDMAADMYAREING